MERTTPIKLCSSCGINPPASGQRWCRACKTANAAKNKEKMPQSVSLDDVLPDEHNANSGTDRGRKVLGSSVRDFGFGRSIVLDKNNRTIAGNKTVEAAKAAGHKSLRVIETDGTELFAIKRMDLALGEDAAATLLGIADNRSSELSLSWDGAELLDMSKSLDLSGMFTAKELGALTAGARGESTATDEVPDLPAVPKTRPGDLWLLGRHRLYCGDATLPETAGIALGGLKAHLVWTDPPYNVDYVGKTADALVIKNDLMSAESFTTFMRDVMRNIAEHLYPGGAIYVAHSDSFGHIFRNTFIESGLLLKQCLIWAKDAFVMGRQDHQWQHEPVLFGFKAAKVLEEAGVEQPDWQHEPVLYGWKPGAAHNWFSDRRQSTILSFARPKRSTVHPTMKPVALVEYCVRNSSSEGQTVFDPFGGSGTTLMACEASLRNAVLLELDPAYCDVIVERFELHTGIKAVLQASE